MSLAEVQQRVAEACARAGRQRSDVELLAVSKGQPVDKIRAVYSDGQRLFGESRAQELATKFGECGADVTWHFIGPLQRNKVRQVRPAVSMLQSLDRIELAEAWMKGPGLAPPTLLQVRLGGEVTKHGFEPADVPQALDTCQRIGVRVVGLMTIPPPAPKPDGIRPWFSDLRKLRDRLVHPGLTHLSMGMSHDYEVAIEEGATIIRVGSAIFGDRTR